MATEDDLQISSKKLYLFAGIALLLILGFYIGKIYTTWSFSQNYVFFHQDDVRDMCEKCRYSFEDWSIKDSMQDFDLRGENETDNKKTNET